MSQVETYLAARHAYVSSAEILRSMIIRLTAMAAELKHPAHQPNRAAELTVPATAEIHAAVAHRKQAWDAMKDAWRDVPDDYREGLTSPPDTANKVAG